MIQGKQKESKELYTKSIGIFEGKPIAFNPNKQELEAILGTEIEKEPEYVTKETMIVNEGTPNEKEITFTRSRVSVWLEDVKTNKILPLRFTIDDREYVGVNTGKTQYINNIGTTSWAMDESGLPDWFVEREYRVAKVGEEALYKFLRGWLSDLDYRDFQTVVQLDMNKLMKGDVKELRETSTAYPDNTVTALATVRISTGDEIKEYQSVYNKEFLPGNAIKYFRMQGKKQPDLVTKFITRVSDPNYGCKDVYVLSELTEHDSSRVIVGPKIVDDTDSSY